MTRFLLLQILVLFVMPLFAQDNTCNCTSDFIYIRQKIEKEHPGFKYNIKISGQENYDTLVASVAQKIDQEPNISRETCAELIGEYLAFFKDKHLAISANKGKDKAEANLTQKMSLQVLDNETHYVRLPTFYKTYWREIDAFYDSIIPILPERTQLIIDLRNNTGGGERQYNQLLKFLKKNHSNPQEIALIYNRYCASACEQFIMKMKKSKKVKTYGENSYGAFAYGAVMQSFTPNCLLQFRMPSKKFNKYLEYEYYGITPDVKLEVNNDWVKAVQLIMDSK